VNQHNQKSEGKAGLDSRLVAIFLLTRIMDDGRNLDALTDAEHGLSRFLKLSPLDRSMVRAILVTALRKHNQIEHALNQLMSRKPPRKARFLIHALHISAAQILFMDLPDSAAVNLGVTAIGKDERTSRFKGMANAVLRRLSREKEIVLEKVQKQSAFPKWFEKQLQSDFGKEKTRAISQAVTLKPHVDLTVKYNSEKWAEKLEGVVLTTGTVRLNNQTPVDQLEGFSEGEWWVQDAAATIPAKLFTLEKGSNILELCAAPGGKTAQLCNAGYNVSALDISSPRLARLEQNLARLKLQAKTIEADILEWEPDQLYDGVLLDAPCSSTGTIRRHPDVLWTKSDTDISELAELQFQLLKKAVAFLKPGGELIFSNCSIFKKEGENLLARASKELPELSLNKITPSEVWNMEEIVNGQGAVRTLPYHLETPDTKQQSLAGMDGFFACRFIKA